MSAHITVKKIRDIPRLPEELQRVIRSFLLDKRTGNIQINICRGEIRGFHTNEIRQIAEPKI